MVILVLAIWRSVVVALLFQQSSNEFVLFCFLLWNALPSVVCACRKDNTGEKIVDSCAAWALRKGLDRSRVATACCKTLLHLEKDVLHLHDNQSVRVIPSTYTPHNCMLCAWLSLRVFVFHWYGHTIIKPIICALIILKNAIINWFYCVPCSEYSCCCDFRGDIFTKSTVVYSLQHPAGFMTSLMQTRLPWKAKMKM